MKLLYIGDGPETNTGFAQVSMGLLSYLHSTGKYDILQVGINYNAMDLSTVPWKVVEAGFWSPQADGMYAATDSHGFIKVQKFVESFNPDITLINNDYPVAQKYLMDDKGRKTALGKHRSKKILYAPLDSWPFPPAFVSSARLFDLNIAYSYWQYDLMRERDPAFIGTPVLYHGVDTSIYQPMDKLEAKKKLIGIFKKHNKKVDIPDFTKKYIVYFVGTNQWRKDIPCLFKAFKEFNEQVPEAYLIPHTNMIPMGYGSGGWALNNLQRLVGVKNAVLMKYANIFTEEEMNIFYNAADVLAYPTRGEGFGLPSLQAMATKTPVVATRFGPQFELHSEGRGYFIDVVDLEPGPSAAYTYFAKPSAKSLTEKLLEVYNNPDEAAKVADNAHIWVQKHTWENKGQALDGILCQLVSNKLSTSPHSSKRRQATSPSAPNAEGSTPLVGSLST